MSFLDLFRKDDVIGAKVLVCTLDTRFEDLVSADFAVYSHFYPTTIKAIFPTVKALLGGVARDYDIVHLLCDVTERGTIADAEGGEITGTELIQKCCDEDVKLLWVANDNQAERYIKGFAARGKRLNLVMTLKRKGPSFPDSLQKLLSRLSSGDTMPVAWNGLWPQVPGSKHADAPESIFFAGRGGVRLR